MPTNLEIATSKFLHPSNSEKFFPHDRDSIQDAGQPFPMVEFLKKQLTPEEEEKAATEHNKYTEHKDTEYADDDLINPLHSIINRVITDTSTPYMPRYQYLVQLLNAKEISIDEFMSYGRVLSRAEAAKQVSENPETAGDSTPLVSKLPSQGVNSVTPTGTTFSASRGILDTGLIRRIASKLSANWGNKSKS